MATFNVDSLDFVDDEEARFGAGDAFASRYSSSNSRLEIEDLPNATTAFLPQDVGTDLVGGKFAETVSEGKALADDGNTYSRIQTAVDNANSWVKVGPGDFREDVSITTNGLTVTGSGDRTKVLARDLGFGIDADNVYLSDLYVDGGSDDNAGEACVNIENENSDCIVYNVTAVNSRSGIGLGVLSGSGTGCMAINCTVKDTYQVGIYGGDSSVISSCYLDAPANIGIYLHEQNSNIICTGNKVRGTLGTGDAIRINSSDSVVGYNITENFGRGIVVNNQSVDSIVFNNRVLNAADESISDNGTGTVLDANLTT